MWVAGRPSDLGCDREADGDIGPRAVHRRRVSASPTQTAPPQPSVPAASTTALPPADANLEIFDIPQEFTTPLLEAISDGESIVWSSGAAEGREEAPDLYRYVPGAAEPELIYRNFDRDSYLIPIATAAGRYVFSELNTRLYGQVGWGLWYLEGPNAQPVELDRFDPNREQYSPYPWIAMDSERVVWTSGHGPVGASRSDLLMVEIPSLERTVLRSEPYDERQMWFVDLDDGRVVYDMVLYATDDHPEEERHVYLLDVRNAAAEPQRLDTTGLAAMPLITGNTVVWKETTLEFDARNWGTLVRHSLTDGTTQPLDFGPNESLNYPAMGDRFVVAWATDDTNFYIHDLVERRALRVLDFEPTSHSGIVRPHVQGDLLVFVEVYWDPELLVERPLLLRWAWLPP